MLMKCGCIAQGKTSNDKSICITHMEKIPMEDPPDLSERVARCEQKCKSVQSSPDLPFFVYQPDREFDTYYCGCRGWN